jgi:hypothetical protein
MFAIADYGIKISDRFRRLINYVKVIRHNNKGKRFYSVFIINKFKSVVYQVIGIRNFK